jgi:hypothetical protein
MEVCGHHRLIQTGQVVAHAGGYEEIRGQTDKDPETFAGGKQLRVPLDQRPLGGDGFARSAPPA